MFLSAPTNHLLRSASTTRGAAAARRLVSTPAVSSATTRPFTFPSLQHLLTRQQLYLKTTSAAASLTTAAKAAGSSSNTSQRANVALGVLGGLALASLHSATGSQNEFFDFRFTTEKSPDDLASFYGGEEFMELYCIFPFVGQIMMRNSDIDENGDVISTGMPGTLNVSMVFSDEMNEDTGETDWFNKRERFRDVCFGMTCWDMVVNFGFRTREDGQTEVYHFGEYFHGNLPIVSQVMKIVFKIHGMWVAWSAEHHINHYAFDSETEEEEEMEEESRRNMPMFLLKNYAWADLKALLFRRNVEKPSFLLKKKATSSSSDDEEEDEDEDEEEDLLPIQRNETMYQISQDIAIDHLTNKGLLKSHATVAADDVLTPEDIKAVLTRSTTKPDEFGGIQRSNTYAVATQIAHMRRRERFEQHEKRFKKGLLKSRGTAITIHR